MEKEGKYIYGIIETQQERNFGVLGVGQVGNEVLTIGCDDLSMVVSNYPIRNITASKDNLLSHQRVIEQVMQEYDTLLPVRFGTLAHSADEVRNLLGRRRREFKTALRDMDHKIELGVKAVWKDMESIFSEIVAQREDIKQLKDQIVNTPVHQQSKAINKVGRLVQEALQEKKDTEADALVDALRRTACDHRLNATQGDAMFMNAAFLVDKGREKEFDNIMDDLSEDYGDRVRFMYAGPLPIFNFVNIVICPEEWEK